MTHEDKVEITSSILIVLLLSLVIALTDLCCFKVISKKENDNVLVTVVTISGLMLGFLITTITLRLGHIDNKIEKLLEGIKSIVYKGNEHEEYKILEIKETKIISSARSHLRKLSRSEHEHTLFKGILKNYEVFCDYRKYNKDRVWYPFTWNLVIVTLSLLLLLLGQSFIKSFLYVFLLSIICFSTIWAIYLSISFVSDLLDNAFINPKQNS